MHPRKRALCLIAALTIGPHGCATRGSQISKSLQKITSQKTSKEPHETDAQFDETRDLLKSDYDTSEIEEMTSKLNTKFTTEQVCHDYEIAIHALALIQAPVGRSGNNYSEEKYEELLNSCPGTYVATARKLRGLQIALGDFHTFFSEPELFRSRTTIIEKCETSDVCSEVVGAPIIPLVTDQGKRSYIMMFDAKAKQRVFRVLSVNGHDDTFLFNDMVQRASQSNSLYGSRGSLIYGLVFKISLRIAPTFNEA